MDTDQGELLQALLKWLATFSVEAGEQQQLVGYGSDETSMCKFYMMVS